MQAKQAVVSEQRKAKRQSVFQPPVTGADRQSQGAESVADGEREEVDLSAMKKKFSKALNKVRSMYTNPIIIMHFIKNCQEIIPIVSFY